MRPDRIAFQLCLIRRELGAWIAPELGSERARILVDIVTRQLSMLESELSSRSPSDTELYQLTSLAADVRSMLPESERASPGRGFQLSVHGEVEDNELQALAAAAGRVVRSVGPLAGASPSQRAGLEKIIRGLIAVEESIEARTVGHKVSGFSTFEDSGGGMKARSAWSDPLQVNADQVETYLRERQASYRHARLRSLRQLPTGFGKDTFFADVETGRGDCEEWVLRRDNPVPALTATVVDEFPLLQALHGSAVPVAEPLWCEPDASVFGAPIMAVRRIRGHSDIASWMADRDRAARIARRCAELLGAIHTLDLHSLPGGGNWLAGFANWSGCDVAREIFGIWRSRSREAVPLAETVAAWLDVNSPVEFVRPSLVHGDYGFHNLLVHDTRVTAVVDWEYAHFGDPHEDLALLRPFVEKVLPWQEFLATYRASGGIEVNPETLRYYTVLDLARVSLSAFTWVNALIDRNERLSLKCGTSAMEYAHRFLIDAARVALSGT